MNKTTYFRLLPRGATILSGALTWLTASSTIHFDHYLTKPLLNYATPIQSPHAPVGALLAQRDACLGDCREAPHPQHATEAAHHNTPLKRHITALQNLAVRCLEPTRQHFGLPIQVTSGYRCPQLNAAVKGAANSQHLAGEAADITIPRRHWPFCYTSSEQIARLLFTWMKDP